MMKKLNYLFVALMTMLLAVSCSQDETLSIDTNSNEAMVSFNLELPDSGPQSRAVGDGTSVNQLVYAVYQVDGDKLTQIGGNHTAIISGKKASVQQSLLKGKTYKMAFWAQKSGNEYYTTTDLTKVSVNYEGVNNDENRDAFFKTIELTVASNTTIDVELKRPFAQLNVGVTTEDWDAAEAADFTVEKSKAKITNVANRINLLTGKASTEGDPVVAEYNLAAIPESGKLEANGKEYAYLSMSYFLVDDGENSEDGASRATLDKLEFEFKSTNDKTMTLTQGLTNVPVQRNYRTNIVGKLLTSDIDFNITIDEIFETPDYNVTTPTVTTAAELTAALKNPLVTDILIEGTIGSESVYTIYNVNRPVTIKGGGSTVTRAEESKAKVFGSFIVKSEGVTIRDLAIQNKGDLTGESSTNRGGIYVFAEKITIENNTITNGLDNNEGLSNAIQIMSPKAGNPLSNYVVKDNDIQGHNETVSNWSSSGIVIAQGYKPGSIGQDVLAITAEAADYQNLLDNNTIKNNKINLIHQDWTNDKLVVLYPYAVVSTNEELETALADPQFGVISLSGTSFTEFTINRSVTIRGEKGAVVDGGIKVKSDDVVIDGLTASYVEIYNGAKGIVVKNNTITGEISSVGIGNSSGPALAGSITILDNVLQIGTIGLYPTETLENYVIKGNKIENNPAEGIWLHYTVAHAGLFNESDAKVFVKNLVLNNEIKEGGESLVKVETATTKITEDGLFNAAKIVKTQEQLTAALVDNSVNTIYLTPGTYIIPDDAKGKTLTFIGTGNPEDTKIATQDDGSYEGTDYSLDGATVTFENITINTDSHTYTGYARCKGTYKNCVINGTYTLYGDSKFENCTFNVSGNVYNIWTWGAPNATFDGCTFNSDGKAMLLYGSENTNLTIENSVFNDKGGLTDLKAAIEIGNDYDKSYTLVVNNTVVNGYEINDKGINTGTTLWANKNSMGTDKLSVTVDGVKVY